MEARNKAAKVFDKYALDYENKYMKVDLYVDSLNVFIENLKNQKASILDIGCGPGNIMRYLLKRNPGYKLMGTDLSPNMLKIAKKNNPSASFRLLDNRKIKEIEENFDGVICSFCIPYLNKKEVLCLLNDTYELLRPNGIFYLSTMKAPHSMSGYVGSSYRKELLYTWYYETDFLTESIENKGFKIIDVKHIINQEEKNKKVRELVIIAKKFT